MLQNISRYHAHDNGGVSLGCHCLREKIERIGNRSFLRAQRDRRV